MEWARPYLTSKRRVFRILDARLGGQYSLAGAQKTAALALQCLSGDARARPGMAQVVTALEQLQDAKETAAGAGQGKASGGFVRMRGGGGGGVGGRQPEPMAVRRLPAAPLRSHPE